MKKAFLFAIMVCATLAPAQTNIRAGSVSAKTATVTPGPTTQAIQSGITTVAPTRIDIEEGSSSSPTTGVYQTKPALYISRYDATDASACITGLTDGCMAAIFRIDGTNRSTTTSSTLTGMLINLWGAKAASGASTYGNAFIGGAFQVWDIDGAVNRVNLYGINPNVGTTFVPVGCWKGIVGDITCARNVLGAEIDVSQGTNVDGVYGQSIGNNFSALTLGCFPINATPKNCNTGLAVGTGTVGHGFWIGGDFGASVQTGLLISQTAISFKPEIGIHVASQGSYGIVVGTGSTTYTHSISDTFANPAIGILFDAFRLEGGVGAANSNNAVWRAATGAATYSNWKEFNASTGFFHWQTDISGSYADAIVYAPNAIPANSTFGVTGIITSSNVLYYKYNGTVGFQMNGTPTAVRTIQIQDADQILVGRDTTDTLTNKTITSASLKTGVANSGTGFKHGRVTTGSIGATTRVDVTLSWAGTAFADTSYTVNCSVVDTSAAGLGLRFERVRTVNTGSIVAQVMNDSAGPLTGTLNCTAVHD